MIKSKVLSVSRRSKYIFINLNNGYTIMIHLGMTGKIILVQDNYKLATSFYYRMTDNIQKHNHLILKFNNNIKLVYKCKKFGFIKVLETKKYILIRT